MSEEKILIKLVIVAVEMICIGVILAFNNRVDEKMPLDLEYEKKIFQENSYYTDANIELEEKYRRNTIISWVTAIRNNEIEKAFDMLTVICKSNLYEDNFNNFERQVVNVINKKISNDLQIELVNENMEDGTIYAEYIIYVSDLKVNIVVEDKGPFTQKIDVKNI